MAHYSLNQSDGGRVKTTISIFKSQEFVVFGKTTEPKYLKKFKQAFGIEVYYFTESVIFQQKIKVRAKQTTLTGKIDHMACTDQKCLPADEVDFSITIPEAKK